jgi:hypothetical protein
MRKATLLVLGLAVLLVAGPAFARGLVINEIFYDSAGADSAVFVELLGTPGLSLDGHALEGVNGNGGAVYHTTDLTGQVIPDDGYFVVGMSNGTNVDMIEEYDWQNGADQMLLTFTGELREIIDSICYGGTADLTCEGDPGPDVPAGSSIARCPDGQDTDNNAEDCYADDTPTPGAENDAECAPPEPTEYTLCEIMELGADGFPIHFGEYVHITSPVTALHDNLIYHGSRLELAVTDYECCSLLFDYNYPNPYAMGTTFDVVGTVDFYNGKVELTALTLTELGTDVVPEPAEITTGELAEYGELYESCLVWICGLTIVEGYWPDEGSSSNITVDDGSGPVTLRIDSDTDIDGSAAPVEPFTAVGVAGQFYTEGPPWFGGYQFLPRNLGDIYSGLDCPQPTPTRATTWGSIKSNYK